MGILYYTPRSQARFIFWALKGFRSFGLMRASLLSLVFSRERESERERENISDLKRYARSSPPEARSNTEAGGLDARGR